MISCHILLAWIHPNLRFKVWNSAHWGEVMMNTSCWVEGGCKMCCCSLLPLWITAGGGGSCDSVRRSNKKTKVKIPDSVSPPAEENPLNSAADNVSLVLTAVWLSHQRLLTDTAHSRGGSVINNYSVKCWMNSNRPIQQETQWRHKPPAATVSDNKLSYRRYRS